MSTDIQKQIVMPVVSSEEAVEAWKKYEDMKRAIATPEDIQKIGDKNFLKKSYWRKVATFFNLTIEVVSEKEEQIGKTIVWHFTCRAIAPNGRSSIGTGSCDAFEKATLIDGVYMKEDRNNVIEWAKTASGKSFPKKFAMLPAVPNSLHNIRSTAETRATNRAISNLVGGGEVSAEEVEQDSYVVVAQKEAVTEKSTKKEKIVDEQPIVAIGKCTECGAPNEIYKPTGKLVCSKKCWTKK